LAAVHDKDVDMDYRGRFTRSPASGEDMDMDYHGRFTRNPRARKDVDMDYGGRFMRSPKAIVEVTNKISKDAYIKELEAKLRSLEGQTVKGSSSRIILRSDSEL